MVARSCRSRRSVRCNIGINRPRKWTWTWRGTSTTVGIAKVSLLVGVFFQLERVSLVHAFQLLFDEVSLATTHSAGAAVSLGLLHLAQHGVLFDSDHIATGLRAEAEPEVANVVLLVATGAGVRLVVQRRLLLRSHSRRSLRSRLSLAQSLSLSCSVSRSH